MTTVADLTQALQALFTTTADHLARRTGFVQRASKLSGAAFAQALVFGWLANPQASVEALAQAAAAGGARSARKDSISASRRRRRSSWKTCSLRRCKWSSPPIRSRFRSWSA